MARFRQNTSDDCGETGIDISPLMDCVFILLIFFIVTTTFVDESGVEANTANATPSASINDDDKTSVIISLTENDGVLYEGQEIGLSGVRPLIKQMLQKEEVPVIIQSDAAARTGMAVRLIDEARLAGATKISITSLKSKS